MRAVAIMVAALLLAGAVGTAEGKRKRDRRGTVTVARGKAPKAWRLPKRLPAGPTATATPAPTAPPLILPPFTLGPSLPPMDPRSVSVRSTEFAFVLSQTTVDTGVVRVQFDNSRAEDPHELAIGRDRFGEVAAGDVVTYSVTLASGRHVLFCPLSGHEELGMRATLVVR